MVGDVETPFATNEEIARVLFQVASLLDILGENQFRVRAYRRAAIGVLYLPKPLVDYVALKEDIPIAGMGERLRRHIADLVNTGHMNVRDALMEDLGEPLVSLLGVPGIGPRTAIRLVRELQVGSLTDLVAAAHQGKIRALRGFGARREAAIAEHAEALLGEQVA